MVGITTLHGPYHVIVEHLDRNIALHDRTIIFICVVARKEGIENLYAAGTRPGRDKLELSLIVGGYDNLNIGILKTRESGTH